MWGIRNAVVYDELSKTNTDYCTVSRKKKENSSLGLKVVYNPEHKKVKSYCRDAHSSPDFIAYISKLSK